VEYGVRDSWDGCGLETGVFLLDGEKGKSVDSGEAWRLAEEKVERKGEERGGGVDGAEPGVDEEGEDDSGHGEEGEDED